MWRKHFTVGKINLLASHRVFLRDKIKEICIVRIIKDGTVYQWALTQILGDNLRKNYTKDEKNWAFERKLHGLHVSQGDCETPTSGDTEKQCGHSPGHPNLGGPSWAGVGPDDLQCSLPVLAILWIRDNPVVSLYCLEATFLTGYGPWKWKKQVQKPTTFCFIYF